MPRRLRSPRFAYIAVFSLGVTLLLIGAFQPNIWYDESYSVALARWDWADIWCLDTLDVHPPLYYLLLHAVRLIFGDSILAYRLFSIAGMVATATLGPTLVRRLWGDAEGLVFSALILLLPNMQHMAWQIRMYSWTVFAATLCFLLTVRIARAAREGERTTLRAWVMFAGASLACAYLHYYGTITAFLVNAGLLVQLLRARRGGGTCLRRAGDGASGSLPTVAAHAGFADSTRFERLLDHVLVPRLAARHHLPAV